MRRLLLACLTTTFVLVGAIGTVRAEYPEVSSPPDVQNVTSGDAAVVVAVEDYAFLPNVEGAVQTANAWESFFTDGLGISDVFTRIDRDATREEILEVAEQGAEAVESGGRLWFVFVGHGAPSPDGKRGLLVGVDAQGEPDSLKARSVAADEVLQHLEAGEAASTVAILDACFSGNASPDESLADGLQPVVPTEDVAQPDGDGSVVLTAAGSDEFAGSLPGAKRPAFSYLMLGALRGWADDDDDSRVTVAEAIDFSKQHLRHLDHQQTPRASGPEDAALVDGVDAETPELASLMRHDGSPPKSASSTESAPAKTSKSTRPSGEEIWERGTEAYGSGDYRKAADLYSEACELEYGKGCAALGNLYKKGKGRARDLGLAAKLLQDGCDLGASDGCLVLAYMFQEGNGVEKSRKKARHLLARGCRRDHGPSCHSLGQYYLWGHGGPRDADRARELLLRAYEANPSAENATALANAYDRLDRYDAARKYFEEGCSKGNESACWNLGLLQIDNREGRGGSVDVAAARRSFERACESGHPHACPLARKLRDIGGRSTGEIVDMVDAYLARVADEKDN